MTNVIVAFSKIEDAKSIKNVLMRSGFTVSAVCTSGSQAVNYADSLNGGIVVSGYRFEDMIYQELHECLPKGFDMLLVASPSKWSGHAPDGIVCLPLPLKVHDLVGTLDMMVQNLERRRKRQKLQPKERNPEEQRLIDQAKELLMDRNNMSETEAHRYIQKCSMDSGTNMVETAQMVISLISI